MVTLWVTYEGDTVGSVRAIADTVTALLGAVDAGCDVYYLYEPLSEPDLPFDLGALSRRQVAAALTVGLRRHPRLAAALGRASFVEPPLLARLLK